jgi:hypothetical protein
LNSAEPWTRPHRQVGFDESGFHVDQGTEGLINRRQHSRGGLNQKALLKGIDESTGDSIDATRRCVRNDLRILVEARQATTYTELRALKCAGNAAD